MRGAKEMIMSYPLKIRQRVEELPQYKGTIKHREKVHVGKKIYTFVLCYHISVAILNCYRIDV